MKNPDILKSFLEELFSKETMKISVKTRTGFYSGDEMDRLLEIYNEFPLSMLIIHPRTREDYYNGMLYLDVFKRVYEKSKNKVCLPFYTHTSPKIIKKPKTYLCIYRQGAILHSKHIFHIGRGRLCYTFSKKSKYILFIITKIHAFTTHSFYCIKQEF